MPKRKTIKIDGKVFDKEWLADFIKTRTAPQAAEELGISYSGIKNAVNYYHYKILRVTEKKQSHHPKAKDQLCWTCEKATNGNLCPWVRDFSPVPGWEAEPTKIFLGRKTYYEVTDSYKITKCPLYEGSK